MGKIHIGNRKILIGILAVLLVVFLVAAALLGLDLWERRQGAFPPQDTAAEKLSYNGREYVLKDRLETFLFIGLDTFEEETDPDSYNNDRQADFLMLCSSMPEKRRSSAMRQKSSKE